jgi:alpha-methylacyl-CoA racemase
VIDCAMTDGAASLMSMFYGFKAMGMWQDEKGANLLDGGAHFYDTYETSDGKWISIGSIEPQFYALLLEKAGLSDPEFQAQMDRAKWPSLKEKIARVIATQTRDAWDKIMEGTDVCYAPVLSLTEAPNHAHNKARATFIEIDGVVQPAPAPRFSRTKPEVQGSAPTAGQHNDQILGDWGFSSGDIAALKSSGAI